MTNKEWLQNMLIDELVDFFQRDFMPCGYCDSEFVNECDRVRNVDCFLAWKNWLEAEHEGELTMNKCGDCVFLEKDDGFPYCVTLPLYTERDQEHEACEYFFDRRADDVSEKNRH